ncbi:hypothetical protein HGB48_37170, partial [Actinomadura latina]|nr:hypothetical protein [Actinomadura latina]
MTEDNRGPVRAPSEDDEVASGREPERQEAAAPPETVTDQEIPAAPPVDGPEPADDPEPAPGAADGDRLVAGGFAPPDSLGGLPDTSEDVFSRGAADMGPQEVPLQDVRPHDMPQPPPPVPLDKPGADDDRPRPGFVPHNHDPRAAQGGPPGGWPHQSHQGPPP